MDSQSCMPYSNFLQAIPVPDKTATTAANALLNDVFLSTGFPSVLQSDHGGEWLNALLHMITKLLSIKHVFTSGFRPHLNGATELTHHFLNVALGIFCEKQQQNGNSFYNWQFMPTRSPQFLVLPISHYFPRLWPSCYLPETISLELPVHPLPPNHYAKHLISCLQSAHKEFTVIKADLLCKQKDIYDQKARFLNIPDGKVVYICKEPPSHLSGHATRFIRHFDGLYLVTGHPYQRSDLLTLNPISYGILSFSQLQGWGGGGGFLAHTPESTVRII